MTQQDIDAVDNKGMPESTQQDLFDIACYVCELRNTLSLNSKRLKLYADDFGLSFSVPERTGNNILIGDVVDV